MTVEVTSSPLDLQEMIEKVSVPDRTGSLAVHFAVVKRDTAKGASAGILFTPTDDVESELREIETELLEQFNLNSVILVRRMGELRVGDTISMVAVTASGHEQAFEACRQAIKGFKSMKSFSKEEIFE